MASGYNNGGVAPIDKINYSKDAHSGLDTTYNPLKVVQSESTSRYTPNNDYWSKSNITKSSFNLVGKNWLANPFAPNPDAIGFIGKTTQTKVNEFGEKIEVPIRRTEIAWA